MFPRAILPAASLKSQSDGYSQARQVKERLARWRRGEYRQLWDEAIKMTKNRPKPKKKGAQHQEQSQDEVNARRALQLAQLGQYTRALQSLCSSGLAQHNRSTINQMRAKHPAAAHAPSFQQQTETPPMTFTQAQVVKQISSFKKGSAPGPSGLRPGSTLAPF